MDPSGKAHGLPDAARRRAAGGDDPGLFIKFTRALPALSECNAALVNGTILPMRAEFSSRENPTGTPQWFVLRRSIWWGLDDIVPK